MSCYFYPISYYFYYLKVYPGNNCETKKYYYFINYINTAKAYLKLIESIRTIFIIVIIDITFTKIVVTELIIIVSITIVISVIITIVFIIIEYIIIIKAIVITVLTQIAFIIT